jgi:hypothetical protein
MSSQKALGFERPVETLKSFRSTRSTRCAMSAIATFASTTGAGRRRGMTRQTSNRTAMLADARLHELLRRNSTRDD